MNEAIRQLSVVLEEWAPNSSIPEMDFTRIRTFEFQEDLLKRDLVSKGLQGRSCLLCENFHEHVSRTFIFTTHLLLTML